MHLSDPVDQHYFAWEFVFVNYVSAPQPVQDFE